jgi:hypothetical protein
MFLFRFDINEIFAMQSLHMHAAEILLQQARGSRWDTFDLAPRNLWHPL